MKKTLLVLTAFMALFLISNHASAYYYPWYTQSSCTDSDGKDYFNKGVVNYNNRVYTDSCLWGSFVREFYCSYSQMRSTYFRCPDGCSNGACIDSTPTQVCGNGIIEGTEACDDGNTQNGDGCSSTCQIQCAEDWDCSDWSSCNSNNYKSRICTDMNACGTTYTKPVTYTQCTCYNKWVPETETIDIGNPTSESGYNLMNWGPIEPDTNGGLWGKSPTGATCCPYGTADDPVAYDGSARVVSTDATGDSASMEVRFGALNFYMSQHLEFMSLLSVSGDDSFDVYIGDDLIYSFVDDGERLNSTNPGWCPENWMKHSVEVDESLLENPIRYEGRNIPDSEFFYAVVNLTFVSTASHWSEYDTLGQVAISEVTSGWDHWIYVCE